MAIKKLKKVKPHDRIDLDIVMGLIGNALLSDSGIKQIQGLMSQAKDPAGVLAQLVYHAVSAVHDKIAAKGMKISDKVWLARGGVVDQSIAEIVKLYAALSNKTDFINPQLLNDVRAQVVQLLQQQHSATQSGQDSPVPQMGPQQGPMPPQGQPQTGGLLAAGG